MSFTLIQYSNQFALGGWSWTVLTYRVQRKVLTSDLGRSYLLPTRAIITHKWVCLMSVRTTSFVFSLVGQREERTDIFP